MRVSLSEPPCKVSVTWAHRFILVFYLGREFIEASELMSWSLFLFFQHIVLSGKKIEKNTVLNVILITNKMEKNNLENGWVHTVL